MALLYRRVSTDEQAREGLSLEAQEADTRACAARHGWQIGGEYRDVLSGARPDRPGYQRLLAEAARLRGTAMAVVVVTSRLDRFGRSVLERARCAEELRALGVPSIRSTRAAPCPIWWPTCWPPWPRRSGTGWPSA